MAVNRIQNRSIRRKSEFQELKHRGKRASPAPWLIVNYNANRVGFLRFGFTISRKVGTAVVRNRLRRWCREFLRNEIRAGNDLGLDINVIFKPAGQEFYKKISHQQVSGELRKFFSR